MSLANRQLMRPALDGIRQQWQSRLARAVLPAVMRQTVRRLWRDEVMPVSWQRALTERMLSAGLPVQGLAVDRVNLGGVPCEQLTPVAPVDDEVIFFVHGGAYVYCSPRTHRPLTARLAQRLGRRTLVPDYRLAPEHVFPAGLEDVLTAWQALLAQGVSADRITLMGDSAGGGMALALALSLRDRGLALPKRLVLLSPWVDLTGAGETLRTHDARDPLLSHAGAVRTAELYRGAAAADHPLVSPLFADLSGLPETLVQVGTEEILLSDAERLAERAAEQGWNLHLQVWDGMFHDFQMMGDILPEADAALAEIRAFVRG